ncbi:MAG: ribonuclease HII [Patescibacteria group bacterium]
MKKPTWKIENGLWRQGYKFIAGIDEVGYGAWVGPVVVGAVIWTKNDRPRGMQDSKKLSARQRLLLSQKIKGRALVWGVGEGSIDEINQQGLAGARQLAIHRALCVLKVRPDYLLIDGNKYVESEYMGEAIIGGDGLSPLIAAASIVAKVYRDAIMTSLHRLYRRYGWARNKGYGTKFHQAMIAKYGLTAHHRCNYKCFDDQRDQ